VREYQPSGKEGVAFAAIVLGGHGKPDFAVEVPREKVIWNSVRAWGHFHCGR